MNIKIIDIKYPDFQCVRKGLPGQELIFVFSVDGDKFRCTYIQEHYFYRGMPGEWKDHCSFEKIARGEVVNTIKCDGEFRIPHEGRAEAYCDNEYNGNDPRFLHPSEEYIMETFINPFINRYF